MNEAARLAEIRSAVRAIAPAAWSRVHDGDGSYLEAQGPMGELLPVARFHPGASEDEIEFAVNAPRNVRFLLGLVDRAIKRLRPAEPPADKAAKNYAAEAAIKCGEPAFKKFLEERHGLERPLTDERAAQKLRSLLGIGSRKNLNSDAAAADRWKRLRDDFNAWRKAS